MLTLLLHAACGALLAPVQNTRIVDHYNYNHQQGRHDQVRAFFFDVLGLVADPRKEENLAAGKGTVRAN